MYPYSYILHLDVCLFLKYWTSEVFQDLLSKLACLRHGSFFTSRQKDRLVSSNMHLESVYLMYLVLNSVHSGETGGLCVTLTFLIRISSEGRKTESFCIWK